MPTTMPSVPPWCATKRGIGSAGCCTRSTLLPLPSTCLQQSTACMSCLPATPLHSRDTQGVGSLNNKQIINKKTEQPHPLSLKTPHLTPPPRPHLDVCALLKAVHLREQLHQDPLHLPAGRQAGRQAGKGYDGDVTGVVGQTAPLTGTAPFCRQAGGKGQAGRWGRVVMVV